MKILIVGAGIAGLTTAFWLAREGHDLTIVEKSPALREAGYMIDFFGSGYDVAEKMEILAELEKIHYPISKLAFLDDTGREKFSVSYPEFRKLFDNRHFNFMRGDLERVLHSQIADYVPIKFGTTVKWFQFAEDEVCAELSDGAEEVFDLVVGADGVHSQVRELVFGEDRQFSRFLGYYTAAFIVDQVPATFGVDDAFYMLTVPGKQVGVYPIGGDRLATFFVYKASRRLGDFSAALAQRELRNVYGDLAWIVPELLEEAKHTSIYFDEVSQIEMPGWSHGRVVLVGDACQCVSLAAGQGASLAMAGGYVLSKELAKGGVLTALASYQQKMKSQITEKQRAGRRIAKWFVPDTNIKLSIRDVFIRLMAWPSGQHFFKRFLATKSLVT